MSVRVVLLAEGGLETSGELGLPPAPGTRLHDDHLGPGHLLVRRCLALVRKLPPAAIQFEAPLRDRRGNHARGTALLNRDTLRQLLSWPLAPKRPDLAVILVDCDEDPSRKKRLEAFVADLVVPKVIAVAVQEFEAWLIADHAAVNQTLGTTLSTTKNPEQMARREAKDLLRSWIRDHVEHRTEQSVRMTLANLCDLQVVRTRCSAFDALLKDMTHSQ